MSVLIRARIYISAFVLSKLPLPCQKEKKKKKGEKEHHENKIVLEFNYHNLTSAKMASAISSVMF